MKLVARIGRIRPWSETSTATEFWNRLAPRYDCKEAGPFETRKFDELLRWLSLDQLKYGMLEYLEYGQVKSPAWFITAMAQVAPLLEEQRLDSQVENVVYLREWDEDAATAHVIVRLAEDHPELLSDDERQHWEAIKDALEGFVDCRRAWTGWQPTDEYHDRLRELIARVR
jgi:hypothetical protein